uniref:Uncharacterized protein n=1 Tax=Arundo donax TaxID=35708 RepID=A0A0A9H7J7_ARUDO
MEKMRRKITILMMKTMAAMRMMRDLTMSLTQLIVINSWLTNLMV